MCVARYELPRLRAEESTCLGHGFGECCGFISRCVGFAFILRAHFQVRQGSSTLAKHSPKGSLIQD